jgi:YggT family protein
MLGLLLMIVTGLKWLIIADAILSWVMPPEQFPRSLTTQLTDPLYAPIRAVLKPQNMGGFDPSPIIMLFAMFLLESMIVHSAG